MFLFCSLRWWCHVTCRDHWKGLWAAAVLNIHHQRAERSSRSNCRSSALHCSFYSFIWRNKVCPIVDHPLPQSWVSMWAPPQQEYCVCLSPLWPSFHLWPLLAFLRVGLSFHAPPPPPSGVAMETYSNDSRCNLSCQSGRAGTRNQANNLKAGYVRAGPEEARTSRKREWKQNDFQQLTLMHDYVREKTWKRSRWRTTGRLGPRAPQRTERMRLLSPSLWWTTQVQQQVFSSSLGITGGPEAPQVWHDSANGVGPTFSHGSCPAVTSLTGCDAQSVAPEKGSPGRNRGLQRQRACLADRTQVLTKIQFSYF